MHGHADNQFEIAARPPMTPVPMELVVVQPTMQKALALCQTISGKDDAKFYGPGAIVKQQAQWSRIFSPSSEHHFPAEKLNLYMDTAQNEAPLLWLLHSRGYDLASLRKVETETERELRLTREELAKVKAEREVERKLFRELRIA